MIVCNGVDVESGNYVVPPIGEQSMADAIAQFERDEDTEIEQRQRALDDAADLALPYKSDPTKLDEAGWCVLFPAGQDPDIRRAMAPLLQRREEMAGGRYRCFAGDAGFAGQTKVEFLRQRGAPQFGAVDPDRVPYYMLIVGGPNEIPFDFQRQIGLQYAVGRIDFDDVEEYQAYCANVLASEDHPSSVTNCHVVASRNQGDLATELSSDKLAAPIARALEAELGTGNVVKTIGTSADATAFKRALGRNDGPTLSFTASHGAGFAASDPLQHSHQGALISSAWNGPGQRVERDQYVAAEDIPEASGLIAFNFACFSGGTPRYDSCSWSGEPMLLAETPFVSGLAKGLLASGALAVVGHVDIARGYSFLNDYLDAQTAVYTNCLRSVLDGLPVGAAMEWFAHLCGDFGAQLAHELEQVTTSFKKVLPGNINPRWVAATDAGAFAIAGDPAVRFGARI